MLILDKFPNGNLKKNRKDNIINEGVLGAIINAYYCNVNGVNYCDCHGRQNTHPYV